MTGGTGPPGCGAREAAGLTYQPSLRQHRAGRKFGRVSQGALCAQSTRSGVFHGEPFFRCHPCQAGTKGHLGCGEMQPRKGGRRTREEERGEEVGAGLLLRLRPSLSPPSSQEDGSPLPSPRSAPRAPCPHYGSHSTKECQDPGRSGERGYPASGVPAPNLRSLRLPWPARCTPPPTTQGPHL